MIVASPESFRGWIASNRESVSAEADLMLIPGLINRPGGGTPTGLNHTVPYGTVLVFAWIPGNKLPRYFHSVPTGQRHLTPVHEFGATPALIFEHEDEHEHEDDDGLSGLGNLLT